MAKSKIVLEFFIESSTYLGGQFVIQNSLSANLIDETFVSFRSQNNQTTISDEVDTSGNSPTSAFNYFKAVSLDNGNSGLYTISIDDYAVTIEAVQDGVVFTVPTDTTEIEYTITNEAATPVLTIDSYTFTEADSDTCNNVKVNVTTNDLATIITSPVSVDPNTANPFTFDWVRGGSLLIECENTNGTASETITLPDVLSISNATIDILNTPTGGNITIGFTNVNLLTLEYSLDNITFQTSNIFTGITDGIHNLYVKDQLGCTVQTTFEIDIFTPDISVTVPYFYISKSMSIRFKKVTDWGNYSDYKTEENTLSCEYNVLLPYKTYQQFQTYDVITTQFKSNYPDITANVIKEDGTITALTINKLTENLGKTDKRDATYYAINDTQTGIYFTSGNIYDYDTGLVTETYSLNGLLPSYAAVDNYINLDGLGWFTITEIIYSDDKEADVIVIENVYLGSPASIIASSEYNLFNYDVFEFDTDFSSYENEIVQVQILNEDTVFDTVTMLSEQIEVSERFTDTIEIKYYNTENTDVFYATGIENKIRVEYQSFAANIDGEVDPFKTDTSTILLSSEMYETNILIFTPVTVAIMRQITQALIHKELYIDGIKYTISELPEVENYPQTNLQVISATLIKDGNIYNSENAGEDNEIDSGLELIGLIKQDSGYQKVN